MITIRGIIPREYVVNAHYYANKAGAKKHVPCQIQVIKLNPYTLVHESEFILYSKGQEKTAVRFTVSDEGDFYNVNSLAKSIVYRKKNPLNPTQTQMNAGTGSTFSSHTGAHIPQPNNP